MQQRYKDNRSTREMKIHEAFLNHCRREKVPVLIRLLSKTLIEGEIVGFDNQTIVLLKDGTQQLLFKHAIASVEPQQAYCYIFNDAGKEVNLKAYPEYPADFS